MTAPGHGAAGRGYTARQPRSGRHSDFCRRVQAPRGRGPQPHPRGARSAFRPRHSPVGLPQAGRRPAHVPVRIGGRRRNLGAAIRSSACLHAAPTPSAATRLEVREHGELTETRELADPLAEVDRLRASFSVPKMPDLPAFTGGLVGYFGFETIGWIEPRLAGGDKPDQLGTPDALLMLSEEVAVFDNLKGRLYLIVHADPAQPQAYARALRRLDELVYRLRHSGRSYPDVLDPSLLSEAGLRFGLHQGRLPGGGGEVEGIHPRRRHLPGGAEPAHERAVPRPPGGRVPRAACAQSLALHVFPRPGRHPGGGQFARDPGAPAGRRDHRAADRRHPPARRHARGRCTRSRPSCWPIRRSAPST